MTLMIDVPQRFDHVPKIDVTRYGRHPIAVEQVDVHEFVASPEQSVHNGRVFNVGVKEITKHTQVRRIDLVDHVQRISNAVQRAHVPLIPVDGFNHDGYVLGFSIGNDFPRHIPINCAVTVHGSNKQIKDRCCQTIACLRREFDAMAFDVFHV